MPEATFQSLEDLGCPSFSEVMVGVQEGETRYLWQMRKDPTYPGDTERLVLPLCIGRVLDREFARYVTANEQIKLKPITTFGIHVNFQTEVAVSWSEKRTVLRDDGSRTLIKPSKTVMVVNFNRLSVEIKLDDSEWKKLRCVKVTHDSAKDVVVEGALADVLTQRLHMYHAASDEEKSEDDADDTKQDQDVEAAEQEGFFDVDQAHHGDEAHHGDGHDFDCIADNTEQQDSL